jgi:DNA-binding MarR family transcriptional regulator
VPLSDPQRRALALLADAPHHRSVANMLAYGVTNKVLDRLVQEGLATMEPGATLSGTRRITVIRVTITESGRKALAGDRSER